MPAALARCPSDVVIPGIVTKLRPAQSGVDILLFPKIPLPAQKPPSLTSHVYGELRVHYMEIKRVGPEADHPHRSSVDIKHEWSYILYIPYMYSWHVQV